MEVQVENPQNSNKLNKAVLNNCIKECPFGRHEALLWNNGIKKKLSRETWNHAKLKENENTAHWKVWAGAGGVAQQRKALDF